jgi:general secretion pathway protein E
MTPRRPSATSYGYADRICQDGTEDGVRPLVDILVDLGKIGPEDLVRLNRLQATSAEPPSALLLQLGMISGRDYAQALSVGHGLPVADKRDFPATPILLDRLSPRFLKDARVLPLAETAEGVRLAMADPGDDGARRAVELAIGAPVLPVVAATEDLDDAFRRYFEGGRSAIEKIVDDIAIETDESGDPDVEHLKDLAQEAPVIRLVNQIVADAIRLKASDIHLESYRDTLKLRYRIHGILREMTSPPVRLAPALISRVKILARLNIAERRLPQDGRARFTVGGRSMDMRVATMPTMHGENVVIRLLDTGGMDLTLEQIGFAPPVESAFRRQLGHSYGIALVTGPTGSGKTTTLYAALRLLNDPGRKILTVEDPIEYQIDGINQIAVRPQIGLDFARVLRACMRHDPDVIMVGEIRDGETAAIAVQAALTGHLVLSTLHTNSAAGSINRLLDMGVDGFLLTSTIRCVIAQRLVRQLCPQCRRAHPAPAEVLAQAGMALPVDGTVPMLYEAVGCEACEDLGYIGRIGIFEYLELDETMREMLRDKIATATLTAAARAAGMMTMFEDGLRKCFAGLTTLAEVHRVTEEW